MQRHYETVIHEKAESSVQERQEVAIRPSVTLRRPSSLLHSSSLVDKPNHTRPLSDHQRQGAMNDGDSNDNNHSGYFQVERQQLSTSKNRNFRSGNQLDRRAVPPSSENVTPMKTLGDYLARYMPNQPTHKFANHNDKAQVVPIPRTSWIHVDRISPLSSLHALVASMNEYFDHIYDTNGILDLDAVWSPEILTDTNNQNDSGDSGFAFHASSTNNNNNNNNNNNDNINNNAHGAFPLWSKHTHQHDNDNVVNRPLLPQSSWIKKAYLILSPFARPSGWYVQLPNRSVVYALLTAIQTKPFTVAWKEVMVREGPWDGPPSPQQLSLSEFMLSQYVEDHRSSNNTTSTKKNSTTIDSSRPLSRIMPISDATLRVENLPNNTAIPAVRHLFRKYNLANGANAVLQWEGYTPDGLRSPTTFLVHFANAASARAALRELQLYRYMEQQRIILVPYPQQYL
jgi:hypothetical protein